MFSGALRIVKDNICALGVDSIEGKTSTTSKVAQVGGR